MHRILLVEDEPMIASAIEFDLTRIRGVLIDSVRLVEDAIRRLRNAHYRGIVVDLQLPIDGRLVPDAGYDIIKEAARQRPPAFVVIITQQVDREAEIIAAANSKNKMYKNIVQYVVFKPYDTKKLKKAISQCMTRKSFHKLVPFRVER